MFKVDVKKRAFKSLEKLTSSNLESVKQLVKVLRYEPIPYMDFDVAKLAGRTDDYRVRVGAIRVVYSVDWVNKVITVNRIESRGRAYKP